MSEKYSLPYMRDNKWYSAVYTNERELIEFGPFNTNTEAYQRKLSEELNQYHAETDKKQAKWDIRFLNLARLVSTWSKDPSTQTGSVIVRPDRTVCSVGFNGFPMSMPDNPEYYNNREEKYSRIVHCEMNALLHARESVEGYTLYNWAAASCDRCVVHMLQAGIKIFVNPLPTEDMASRWGEAFKRTAKYIAECGGVSREYPRTGELA